MPENKKKVPLDGTSTPRINLFADVSTEEEIEEKKPLMREFYKAHPDLLGESVEIDIIFPAKAPYYAYGILTPKFRFNLKANTAYGKALKSGLEIAIAKNAALLVVCRSIDEYPGYDILLTSEPPTTWEIYSWGWKSVV